MLGDLEALHHVEAPRRSIGWLRSTARNASVDHHVLLVDGRGVDTHYSCAGFPLDAQPSALAASKIGDVLIGIRALSKGTICSAERTAKEAKKR